MNNGMAGQQIPNNYGPQGPMNNGYPQQPPMGPQGPMGPYPQQPMMNPPKQPMDPAKKKKIILIVSIISGVVVLGIAAAILIPILLRIDYASAYNTAKELKPVVSGVYYASDCEYITDYLENDYISIKTYNEYVEDCRNELTRSDLVDQLGETPGVKRNNDIKIVYDQFKTAYDAIVPSTDVLDAKLEAYKARHSFVVTVGDISLTSSDAEITAAANYLINSGNETLKTYGEGWLEKYLAAAHAYQAWRNGSSRYSGEEYELAKKADNERKDYVTNNKPDIKSLYPLNLDDASKMKNMFDNLYDLIRKAYEKNYNSGSGDCVEFLGEVVCE